MKLLSLLPLLLCFSAANLCAQRALQKNPSTGALIEGFKSGAFTIEIDATGTLKWNSGSTLTNADHFRTAAGLTIGTNVQAYDADLTTYAGITPSANVQSLLGAADYAAVKTLLALTIGTNVQAYDADLTTYAGITPSANVQSLLGAADYSAFRTALGLGSVATLNVSAAGNATNNAIPQLDATGRFITHNALGVADPGNLTRTGELAVDGVIFSDVSGSGFFQFITLATPTANRTHTLPDASGTLINTGNLTSITALGTVTTGTWQASDIALAYLAQGGATDGQAMVWDNTAGTWEPGTISTGLTVGTTTTSGAASGDILTSDGTLLQKLTPGTGVSTWLSTNTKANLAAAVSDDDPAFLGSANAYTAAQTITLTSLGATATAGISLINSTAATSGNQQVSPGFILQGNGYGTTGGASQTVAFRQHVLPVQGTTPTGTWTLGYSINGGAYTTALAVTAAGALTTAQWSIDSTANMSLQSNSYIRAGGRGPNLGVSGFGTAHNDTGPCVGSSGAYQFSDGASYGGTIDTSITRVSAGVVGLPAVRVGSAGTAIAAIKRATTTLVAGTATISDTATTANSQIVVTVVTPGGTIGFLDVDLSAGVGYTINSSSILDTSALIITAIHHP